ncbi:cyclin-SDS [Actinidia eriantha]|uniref:cyclin-SDS n=1 Tax=Actinidia eriantha TaxID=165200 RepID=UPI002589C5EC|nr:cyclin-SDS [Actinidia eriantha]
MKRKLQPVESFRKLRSKLPRRRRLEISPILRSDVIQSPIDFPAVSSASSKLAREVSCNSSRVSVNKPRISPTPKKRCFQEISGSDEFRRVSKSNYRPREYENKELSYVESCSGAETSAISSKLKRANSEGDEKAKKFGGIEDSEAVTKSEVSCVQQISGEFSISKSDGERGKGTGNSLACAEHLCFEDESDYSSAFSDLHSEIFHGSSSDLDFSDYTPSILFESGSEFSERSVTDTSLSPTFSLVLQYRQQFSRSISPPDSKFSSQFENELSDEITAWLRFEDDEHETSYEMLRNRERRQVYLHDYAEEYCSTAEHGEFIIQQRLQMVHWIVEQSTSKELQKETMFLGVSLMDRFLSKGFFKNKRNLQIVGIACLALATRIEENQPFNSVRQKKFCVGSNAYTRYEVVAMEWLVQEVLNFQCFLPTIYNFLWFYLKAARANEEVEKTAKYLAVLALLGHEQLCFWPSTVAAGVVILACLAANQDASCDSIMETHIRTKEDDLPGCIKSLEWLVKYAC